MDTCGNCGYDIRWNASEWIHTDDGSVFCSNETASFGTAFPIGDPEFWEDAFKV